VVCQFGVMFFPDRVAGMREAHRVLKPGGRFFFNVWDKIDDNPVMAVTVIDPNRMRADPKAAGFPVASRLGAN
jgi:ubiquinone/menaquinone biosynthesis C-methylase UbiE